MRRFKLAIVGATGLVGNTILKIIDEENLLKYFDITLYVSARSAGKVMMYKDRVYRFVELNENALKLSFDFVLFSAGASVSKAFAEKFASNGAFVIDNTSAFRKMENIPLVVPEINANILNKNTKLISNPNCSTIELALVIDRLKILGNIQKVVVSTYQSVSGAGRRALLDLKNNTKNVFKNGINNNLIAQIGEIEDNRFSVEENKIMFEMSKILGKKLDVSASAIRVPTDICHGESVYVKFENDVNLIDVFAALDCDYIKFNTDFIFELIDAKESNLTYVCRIRQKNKNELEFFVIADNLRRGAAYNAVKIAKYIIDNII